MIKKKYPKNFAQNRDDAIIEYCRDKKILHVWACDSPFTEEKFNFKIWPLLYREIDKVCANQLWIDLDKTSLEFLNSKSEFKNSKVIYFDMNKLEDLDYQADIIILWEVIEHLMNLETALTNLKKIMNKDTLLIISTPNALAMDFIINSFFWFEVLHHDHKVSFSYWTLSNLLNYTWFSIQKCFFTNLIWYKWQLNIFWKIRKILDFLVLNKLKYNQTTLLMIAKLDDKKNTSD